MIASFEELYIKYIGWYICFSSKSKEVLGPAVHAAFIDQVMSNDYTDIVIKDVVSLGGNMYYVASAISDGEECCLVGRPDNYKELKKDFQLPMYFFIGNLWEPFNI